MPFFKHGNTYPSRTSVTTAWIFEINASRPLFARKSALAKNFCWSSLSTRSTFSCVKWMKWINFRKMTIHFRTSRSNIKNTTGIVYQEWVTLFQCTKQPWYHHIPNWQIKNNLNRNLKYNVHMQKAKDMKGEWSKQMFISKLQRDKFTQVYINCWLQTTVHIPLFLLFLWILIFHALSLMFN